MRGFVFSALGALLLLVAASGCGKHHSRTPSATAAHPAAAITATSALAQLDALEKPECVDSALWEQLTNSLRTALSARGDKLTAAPPTGPANKVQDLTATRETNGVFTLSWHYRNLGDYDQNGVVGVSDITPLAQHFGETYDAQTESDSIQAVIDGSGNAKIGVEDVTQVAQNFGVEVAKYSVNGSDAYAGPFAETAIVGVIPQVSDARKVLTMNIGASPQGYWQVVPQDGENAQGEASNIAGISLQIRSITPMEVKEGTVVTFSADVLGAGPFTYEWDFGGQAVPATSTEASPKVVLTRDTGSFPARLTVTNHLGNTAYPFTLAKLAREWNYEVVLRTEDENERVSIGRLREHKGSLYFAARIWDIQQLATVASFKISGTPGNWDYKSPPVGGLLDLSSQGNQGYLGELGSFMNWSLVLYEQINSTWASEVFQTGIDMYGRDFAYADDDVPFVAYLYRYWEPEKTVELHYARRVEGQWLYGVIDDDKEGLAIGEEFSPPVMMKVDREGNPSVVYTANLRPGIELRLARWNHLSQSWDKQKIPMWSESFDYSFDSAGHCTCVYLDDGISEGSSAIYLSRLTSDTWTTELIKETPEAEYAGSNFQLSYDPLGNSVVSYRLPSVETDSVCVAWSSAGGWELSQLPIPSIDVTSVEDGLYFIITAQGTPYLLYTGDGLKEVILARYE